MDGAGVVQKALRWPECSIAALAVRRGGASYQTLGWGTSTCSPFWRRMYSPRAMAYSVDGVCDHYSGDGAYGDGSCVTVGRA